MSGEAAAFVQGAPVDAETWRLVVARAKTVLAAVEAGDPIAFDLMMRMCEGVVTAARKDQTAEPLSLIRRTV
jgi:hypothetical protein